MAERERLPGRDWQPFDVNWRGTGMHPATLVSSSGWESGPIRVLSALELAELPDGSGEYGPQWHVSISARGKRPKDHHVRRALRAFAMVGAEEDNHHPGNARHFWLPVDPTRRVDCECKAEEATVVEPDGYTYTNPHDPERCRGCEFQRLMGKPCPLHSEGGRRWLTRSSTRATAPSCSACRVAASPAVAGIRDWCRKEAPTRQAPAADALTELANLIEEDTL